MTVVGTQAVIDPLASLAANTGFYVLIDPGAFEDLAGNTAVTLPVILKVAVPSGITLSGFDVVLGFDAAKFSVSNAQIGPLW